MSESNADKKKMVMRFVFHQLIATIIFFIGVFSCYQGVLKNVLWLGPLVILVIALVRFATQKDWLSDLKMLLIVSVITFVFESAMIGMGVYTPQPATRLWIAAPLSPLWICALWANFSLKIRDYMWAMRAKPIRSFIVGLVFALLIFSNAKTMGLVTLNHGRYSLFYCALAWGVVVLVLFHIAGKIFKLPTNHDVNTQGDAP